MAVIDIYSGGKGLARELSNFIKHPFVFRGFQVNSMEGFISGLTYQNPIEQIKVFLLNGLEAKEAAKPWEYSQTVYWQGNPIKRWSQAYQDLFDEAYQALYENPDFRKALDATAGNIIKHTMGCKVQKETLLTEKEFVDRLTRLRDTGKAGEPKYFQTELF